MDRFNQNVAYLDASDFTSDGKLKAKSDKPVVVMVMASWCGFCKKAKPMFQELADKLNNRKAYFAVIQHDGETDDERNLGKMVNKIIPSFSGFPTIVKFVNGKYIATHNGARTVEALEQFI